MSLASTETEESSRRWHYVVSGIVALLLVVVVSLTVMLIDSNEETTMSARDSADAMDQDNEQSAQRARGDDSDIEGGDTIAGAGPGAGDHSGTEETSITPAAGATTAHKNGPRVLLKINSSPEGAQVVRRSDRKVLGKTPFTTELIPEERGHLELLLRAPGYREHHVRIPLSKSSSRTVALDKVAPKTLHQTKKKGTGKAPRKPRRKRKRQKGPGNPYK